MMNVYCWLWKLLRTCTSFVLLTFLLASMPQSCIAQGHGAGNVVADPGGNKTGNRSDILSSNGQPITQTEVWARNADKEPLASTLADGIGQNRIAINIVWTLVTGYLVMFMQVGFALLEVGFCRAKNAAHVFMTNFMIYPISMLGFWACGFAFMFGDMSNAAPGNLGGVTALNGVDLYSLIGRHGFFLSVNFYDVGVFTMFLFQMVFMDTMATIPTGAMAERWRFSAFVVYGLFVSTILYPIYGHWVWGNGWLARMGTNWHLGHGAVDFAGSGVVHGIGGWTALAGAIVLGPRIGKFNDNGSANSTMPVFGWKPFASRIGKFNKNGSANVLPAHNGPMALLGALILAFGWFGFNPGSTLGASGGGALRIGVIATNTMLASAGGAVAAMVYWWCSYKKPDPGMCANGLLAGLVAITAPCAFVNAISAVAIGVIAGIIVCFTVTLIERCGVDDPVGAVAVHGVCGIWGLLAVGIFADGTYGAGWNGVGSQSYFGQISQGVTGLLYGDWSQLAAQAIDCVVNIVWGVGMALLFFTLQKRFMRIRSLPEDEVRGLDDTEMGVLAYPDLYRPDEVIAETIQATDYENAAVHQISDEG